MTENKSKKNEIKKKDEVIPSRADTKQNLPEPAHPAPDSPQKIEETPALRNLENPHLKKVIEYNYLEYASYVIKDRAIPDINDGLKPVQRRILWSLHRMDDGRFHKVANVIGHTMQFHPHGDQSIYGALIVLANTEYFIEKQGNFGNIFTGDMASAARYIECRLSQLAREALFNDDICEFTESYDGRNKEPVSLPAKIPSILLLGHEGIAPGMTTRIFPHNFKETLEAQIAILKNEPYQLYPDFIQGGIMDVSDYQNGTGKITLRAKIDIDGRRLIIREIPATTNTEALISSIEKAANSNKIKIASINDFTTEKVEIEITPQRGYEPEKALNALYAYTDCSVTVSSNILVIKDNKPEMMTVDEILRYCTERLVTYLKRELELELNSLKERLHDKTLAQIFIENRIYKRIEECETYELVLSETRKGLEKFKKLFIRELTNADLEKLLAIQIKRISLFDINKNKQEMDDIVLRIAETEKNLKKIKSYAIKYIQSLIAKFAKDHNRKTKIESFGKIDVKQVALNNIKVGWDRKNCLVGTNVKSEETVTCNEYDRILCVEKNAKYKLVAVPDKLFVDKLFYLCKQDKNTIFNVVYKDYASDAYYAKRTQITKFITDKEYNLAPHNSRLQLFNSKSGYVYECVFAPAPKQKQKSMILDFSKIPLKGAQSRGLKLTNKKIIDFKFLGASTDPAAENPDIAEKTAVENQNIVEKPLAEAKTPHKGTTNKASASVPHPQPQPPQPISPPPPQLPKKISPTQTAHDKQKMPPHEEGKKHTEHARKEKIKDKTIVKKNTDPVFSLDNPVSTAPTAEKPADEKIIKKIAKSTETQQKIIPHQTEKKQKKTPDDDWGIVQPDLEF